MLLENIPRKRVRDHIIKDDFDASLKSLIYLEESEKPLKAIKWDNNMAFFKRTNQRC